MGTRSGSLPIDRALLALSAAFPEHTFDELAGLSLGRRDLLLLQLHQHAFGDRLEAYTECPNCGERLEFALACEFLSRNGGSPQPASKNVTIQGLEFILRCPDSRDAAAAAASEEPETAKKALLTRCATLVEGARTSVEQLPETAQAAIATELASLDPHAEILVDLVCPSCGHAWQSVFDILTFVWGEARARARRLIQQVDTLARAYGWSESDILAMSSERRELYVQMAIS